MSATGASAPGFLSAQWLAALERALRAGHHAALSASASAGARDGPALGAGARAGDEATRGARPGGETPRRLLIGQVVTGAADAGVPSGPALVGGEVRYTLVLGGGEPPEVRAGTVEGAAVTLVTEYEAAAAAARGEQTIAQLLVAGRLKVRGDANALVEVQEQLSALAPALAALASAPTEG